MGKVYFRIRVGHKKANGAKCISDSDCASEHSSKRVCRPFAKHLANGDVCEKHANCASHHCRRDICVSR